MPALKPVDHHSALTNQKEMQSQEHSNSIAQKPTRTSTVTNSGKTSHMPSNPSVPTRPVQKPQSKTLQGSIRKVVNYSSQDEESSSDEESDDEDDLSKICRG